MARVLPTVGSLLRGGRKRVHADKKKTKESLRGGKEMNIRFYQQCGTSGGGKGFVYRILLVLPVT